MTRRTWAAFAALYAGLTLLYGWKLILSLTTALASDSGDPGLNAWIIWWNSQALPFTERWWNAPIFFPSKGAFALSETLVSLAPLTTPLQWMGVSAITAYNVAFLVAIPLTALASHALAHRLTGRHDAGLIAGLAFGFSAYRASQLPHIQMQWGLWMPLCLLALHRYLDSRRVRDLMLVGVCWIFNGLTSGYFLVYFSVLTALWMCWFVRTKRDWLAIGGTLAVASLLLAPGLLGYVRHQTALGLSRDSQEIIDFSADLSAIWATSSAVWLPYHWTIQPRAEGELYPGVTIMVLTVIGAIVVWRRARTERLNRLQMVVGGVGVLLFGLVLVAFMTGGGWQTEIAGIPISLTRLPKALFVSTCLIAIAVLVDHRTVPAWRRRSVLIFYTAASVIMLLFALGPNGRVFGQTFFFDAPYSWLMALPGGHSLRVPARFGALFAMCLAQAAAIAFAYLTPRGAKKPLIAALGVAVALDGWIVDFPIAPVSTEVSLSGGIDDHAAVLELPAKDLYTDTAAMLRATVHKHPLVNGFSGYAPKHYGVLLEGLNAQDPSAIAALQQSGPLIILVVRANDSDGLYNEFVDRLPQSQRLFRSPLGEVYKLPALVPPPPPSGRLVAPSAITVDGRMETGGAMLDGNLATRWDTGRPQLAGDEVTIHFAEPVVLSRIEMDLGEALADFPRGMRVTVSDGPPNPETVWDGGTAGPAVLAALHDQARMPVGIDLRQSSAGRRYTMTLTRGNAVNAWTIAELRTFSHAP